MSSPARTMDSTAILDRVRGLFGVEGAELEGGEIVARPASDAETVALLRTAGEEGWRVDPEGARVGGNLRPLHGGDGSQGAGTARPRVRLSTLRMKALLEHSPADLTVRARAGLTLGALQDAVAGERQWLALDPPGGGAVTLGGIVATGVSGPLRIQYGRPRDQLLGLTLIDGAGRTLALGGRVVKNVAGFDLVRLATGSLGTLGVVTEVTFRLYPIPESDLTLIWKLPRPEVAWELGRALATLPLPLAAAELIWGEWGGALEGSGAQIVLRLQGSPGAVGRMRDLLMARGGAPTSSLEGPDSVAASLALAEGSGEGAVAFRLHTLPDLGEGIFTALTALPVRRMALHLLHGTLRGTLAPGAPVESLASLVEPTSRAGGTLRVSRASEAPPAGTEVGITPAPAVAALHSQIARGFDPQGILGGGWREGWR